MTTQRRWMQRIIEEAAVTDVVFPWERRVRQTGWKKKYTTPVPEVLSAIG